ncbi:MAG TPA: P-II family nitrogen regulator [Nitrosopumilaceae archaeon]|nr:P-II family nitrogen regulator [Nitrosopumilaceae archaeon]
MKRIEAVIQSDKQKAVIDSIINAGVGGLTVTRSLGRGAGERPRIGGPDGEEIQYNAVDTIVTVVDDSEVESVLSAILEAGYSGTKGDGKIFVSNIDDVIDIYSKEKGMKAL